VGRQKPAISRHWIFCSKPAIHFRRCSESAIGLMVINFSACQAGVQRLETLGSDIPLSAAGHQRPVDA
jgi:hypothetical protein